MVESRSRLVEPDAGGGAVLAKPQPDDQLVVAEKDLASGAVGTRMLATSVEAEDRRVPVRAPLDVRDGEADVVDPVDRHDARCSVPAPRCRCGGGCRRATSQ